MKASLSKRELNRQRWYKSFTTWKQNNDNPRAFCQKHQLGLASFQRWRRIFEKEDNQKEGIPVNFLPIRVRDRMPSNLNGTNLRLFSTIFTPVRNHLH